MTFRKCQEPPKGAIAELSCSLWKGLNKLQSPAQCAELPCAPVLSPCQSGPMPIKRGRYISRTKPSQSMPIPTMNSTGTPLTLAAVIVVGASIATGILVRRRRSSATHDSKPTATGREVVEGNSKPRPQDNGVPRHQKDLPAPSQPEKESEVYAEPQRVFPPSPDGPAEALSGAAGTAAANTLAELRAPDQLENGPVQPLIPASESEFSLEGTAAPKAPDLEPSALNEPASAPPPSHASSDPEVRQPDSEGSVPAANPGSCTPRDCASAPPLAPPTPAAHHSPPLGVASPSKNEDGVLQPLAKDGEGLDAVRKLVIRPDARHPANPEAGLLVPADETVAADENGARNEAVVADEGGVAEESLAACEDGEGVEHLAADESGAGGESRAAGGRQGGSKDAAAEESKAANGVEAHGATEISSDAGVESANPVQEALLLPAAEQDDILTSKEGIALGRELDVPTGIVPPSDRKQVSNPQAAFEAALDVEIPDLKLEDIPAPGVPATAAEKRVEQANTLADKLLDDPQKPLHVAIKAQQVALRLALAGGVRPEVLSSAAMLLANMLLHGRRWGEAKEATAIAYAAAGRAERPAAKSQAMTLFGLAWSSEDRLEEAAAAYVAAIGLAEESMDVLNPSLHRARRDLSQILLKMGRQDEAVALLVTSARQLCGLAADTEARTLAAGVTRAALAAAVAGEDGSAGKTRPAQQDQLELVHSARRSAIRSLWEAADLLAPPEVPAGAAEQAEQLLQEAIQVAGEGYGRQSMVFVQCLDALARFSRRQSRLEEALLLYRHQLAILDGFRAYELPMVQHRVLLLRASAEALDQLGETGTAVDYANQALLQAQALVKVGSEPHQRAAAAALEPLFTLVAELKEKTGDKEGAKKARRSMLQARLEKKLPTFTSPGKKGRKATRQNKLKVQTS
uniref:Uncharacterized protein n=1 Tax=Auxenochlorella protothecoides TaxID=3075 RepID=A0A1D1ZXS4_AUXPR